MDGRWSHDPRLIPREMGLGRFGTTRLRRGAGAPQDERNAEVRKVVRVLVRAAPSSRSADGGGLAL